MSANRSVAVALVALPVTTGVAVATPVGQGPTQQADADAPPAGNTDTGPAVANESSAGDDGRASNKATREGEANDRDDAAAAERDPPETFPAQVPTHVREIHDITGSFPSGDLGESLGDALARLLGGENETQATGNAQANGGGGVEVVVPV